MTGIGALVVTNEHRVQVLTVDGTVLCVLDPSMVAGVDRLGIDLFGVALYPGTDDILVTDRNSHRVFALSWSSEVWHFKCCSVGPYVFWRSCQSVFVMGYSISFAGFRVDYWMRGHLEVKAHNWANSISPLVLQSHQRMMSGRQIWLIIAWIVLQ